jgi:hypothetical protein
MRRHDIALLHQTPVDDSFRHRIGSFNVSITSSSEYTGVKSAMNGFN